jgi:hypothetical protein
VEKGSQPGKRQENVLDVNLCAECGVPEPFNLGHRWLNNGDIVQAADGRVRMGFIECETLDPLFANISAIVGASINPLIVNTASKGTAQYLKPLIPQEVKEMVEKGEISVEPFTQLFADFCQILGYGKYEFLAYRFQHDADDFSRTRILHPFSVPEAAGCYSGALCAVVGGEHSISYQELSPGLFELVSHWTTCPRDQKESAQLHVYDHRDGDIELERCSTCGCPKAFKDYYWDLEKGVIVDGVTGRRLALLGYELLDALFNALEAERGDTVPRVIVEAQRRFVKTGFYSIEEVSNEGEFRTALALRGLGNLRKLTIGTGGLHMRIDNVSAHLMTIGMAQGLFETALDTESFVDWELDEEGDLEVEVTPRRIREFITA